VSPPRIEGMNVYPPLGQPKRVLSGDPEDARSEPVDDHPWSSLLDVEGCAAMLGVSVRTWERLLHSGQAPRPIWRGRRRKWSIAEVEAFAAALPYASP